MNFANCNIKFSRCNFSHPMPQRADSEGSIHTQDFQHNTEFEVTNPKTKRNKHTHTTTTTSSPKEDSFPIK